MKFLGSTRYRHRPAPVDQIAAWPGRDDGDPFITWKSPSLQAGDTVEVEISGLGVLRSAFVAETAG